MRTTNKTIGFIGAGKVGTSFGKYFVTHGIEVSGYYSQSLQSAKTAAEFTNTAYFQELTQLIQQSDVLFLTVPDGQILPVWEELKAVAGAPHQGEKEPQVGAPHQRREELQTHGTLEGKLICHCSGALTSQIFSGIEETKAFGFSVHPLLAVSSRYESYQELSNALITIESSFEHSSHKTSSVEMQSFSEMLTAAGLSLQPLRPEQKLRYHSAAVMASNLMVGLIHDAEQVLKSVGFSDGNAHLALAPLLELNARSIAKTSCREALTGPVERNDVETVEKELQELKTLDRDTAEIYRLLSKQVLEVAKERHPDADYAKLKQTLDTQKY